MTRATSGRLVSQSVTAAALRLLLADPQRQSLQALQRQEGVVRRQGGPIPRSSITRALTM